MASALSGVFPLNKVPQIRKKRQFAENARRPMDGSYLIREENLVKTATAGEDHFYFQSILQTACFSRLLPLLFGIIVHCMSQRTSAHDRRMTHQQIVDLGYHLSSLHSASYEVIVMSNCGSYIVLTGCLGYRSKEHWC